jgi:hypothetical protein
MKITRKQLAKIIAEEKQKISTQKSFGSNADRQEKLREGRMKEMEGELIEDIVELLVTNGAIRPDSDETYDEALYWVESALIPHLQNMVDLEAGRNPGGSIG